MSTFSCLLDCFAYVLEVDPIVLIDKLEHDGSEIIRPELPDPFCRRGFNVFELVALTIDNYVNCSFVIRSPFNIISKSDIKIETKNNKIGFNDNQLLDLTSKYIETRETIVMGTDHAVVFDNGKLIHNPGNSKIDALDFKSKHNAIVLFFK